MTEITKMLLQYNTGIETSDKDSQASLYLAAERSGWTQVIKLLLEDNAGIKSRDKNNQAYINHSAEQHHRGRLAKCNSCILL